MNQSSAFKENYHGVLSHDGWIKVAKFTITAKILNIGNGKIRVEGRTGKGNYTCELHKNLKDDLKFMAKNDQVGIKWNCGKPYVVAYRKANFDNSRSVDTGDFPVFNNGKGDWITFFREIDAE